MCECKWSWDQRDHSVSVAGHRGSWEAAFVGWETLVVKCRSRSMKSTSWAGLEPSEAPVCRHRRVPWGLRGRSSLLAVETAAAE